VSKVLLDLDLAPDLLLDFGVDDFGFVEGFEGEDVFRCEFGADHVDATEFAFPQRTANVKCMEVPFSRGGFAKDAVLVMVC